MQGAARLSLAEGGTLRLAFDGRNGRPYTPIGRVLTEQGAIPPDQVSMQSIRAWLDAHPAQARAVMDRNESYVFFRAVSDTDPTLGPIGAMGVALTAGRSAAVDRGFVPLGGPVFVDSTVPDGRVWQHLVLAQDLGSAIVGQARLDVFLGSGEAAGAWAGRMHQAGRLWLLLPAAAGRGKCELELDCRRDIVVMKQLRQPRLPRGWRQGCKAHADDGLNPRCRIVLSRRSFRRTYRVSGR